MSAPASPDSREVYREHLRLRLTQCGVPTHLHEGLIEYIAARRPTGGFLEAVLSNDLRLAARRADDENRSRLYEVAIFLFDYAPEECCGSPELVKAWLSATDEPPMLFA